MSKIANLDTRSRLRGRERAWGGARVELDFHLYNPQLKVVHVVNAVSFSYDSNSVIMLEFYKKMLIVCS